MWMCVLPSEQLHLQSVSFQEHLLCFARLSCSPALISSRGLQPQTPPRPGPAHYLRLYTGILTWVVCVCVMSSCPSSSCQAGPATCRALAHSAIRTWWNASKWAFQGGRSTALHRGYPGPAQSLLPPVHQISLWYLPFPSSAQHKWSREMHWCNVAIYPIALQNVTTWWACFLKFYWLPEMYDIKYFHTNI